MTSLLGLYQRDAAAGDPAPMRSVPGAAAGAATDYLLALRDRYLQAEDVSVRQKQIAAHCLDLAIQAVQSAASLQGGGERQGAGGSRLGSAFAGRQFAIFMALACGLLLINLWLMSISGVFSLFALIAAAVVLHEGGLGLPRRASSLDTGAVAKPRAIPVSVSIEPIVRRIDEIVGLAVEQTETRPEAALKVETLEFFQDILEAVIANDQDYAFKKISRTLEQVLLSEGIEVVTDARNHAAMFAIDTVADASRAGKLETVRPALAQASHCVKSGYAQQFVDA